MHFLLQWQDQGLFNLVWLDIRSIEVIHFFPGSQVENRTCWGHLVKHGQTGGLYQADILLPSMCDKARVGFGHLGLVYIQHSEITIGLSLVRSFQSQFLLKLGTLGMQDSGALFVLEFVNLFIHLLVRISICLFFLTLGLLFGHFFTRI